MDSPIYAFDEKRRQYNSKQILKRLAGFPHDSLKLLAVTDVDLFVPILKYVFGLAEVGGRCAIISTYRLRPQFYGYPPNQDLLMERIEKTALHELGHSLGLIHCRDRRCVMHSSTSIADTDLKQSNFCPTCFEMFRWHIENSGIRAGPHVPKI
jgi:archaemetzincin